MRSSQKESQSLSQKCANPACHSQKKKEFSEEKVSISKIIRVLRNTVLSFLPKTDRMPLNLMQDPDTISC